MDKIAKINATSNTFDGLGTQITVSSRKDNNNCYKLFNEDGYSIGGNTYLEGDYWWKIIFKSSVKIKSINISHRIQTNAHLYVKITGNTQETILLSSGNASQPLQTDVINTHQYGEISEIYIYSTHNGGNNIGCTLNNIIFIEATAYGLLTANLPLNLLDKSKVKGFNIDGVQPTNTNRKLIFKVDNTWNKLNTAGVLVQCTKTEHDETVNITDDDVTADYVLRNGNTIAELTALTDVPSFVGKLVYPAIALYASEEAEEMPTFGMTINAEVDNTVNVYSYATYSQEYAISDNNDVAIVSIDAQISTKGNGNVTITARIKQNNEWTEYMALNEIQNQKANHIQLKAIYNVTTINSDVAEIKNITIKYMSENCIVTGDISNIFTIPLTTEENPSYCYALVKHNQLIDSELKAYAEIKGKINEVLMEYVGSGNNVLTEYTLSHANVLQDSIKIYINNTLIQNFDYENNVIKLSAPTNNDIYVTYQYYTSTSTEIEMTKEYTKQENNQYLTRFSCDLSNIPQIHNISVKYSLIKNSGSINNTVLGIGNGKTQTFKLPHNAQKETITCNCSYSYNQNTRILTAIQNDSQNIIISYDYNGIAPQVNQIFAGLA